MSKVSSYLNFITAHECQDIINNQNYDLLYKKLSDHLRIDSARFETVEITRYKKGEGLVKHKDYFTGVGLDKICQYGGNRVMTAIVYLSTVRAGGETVFPWLRLYETPVEGKLVVIDYSNDSAKSKIKSEHIEYPPLFEEKIVATVYNRERSLTEKINGPVRNYHYPIKPADTSFQLECGPATDRRILKVTVPGNNNPSNTIMLGLTGGMDSSLLLYLVAALNTTQSVPYFIQPIAIDNRLGSSDDPSNKFGSPITERWSMIPKMINMIRSKIPNSNILDLIKTTADPSLPHNKQISPTMRMIAKQSNRYFEYKYIYQGINENPPEIPSGPIRPEKEPSELWKFPFLNLQKTHIVDTIIQLRLEEIFELTSKCPDNHVSLTEDCWFWQCKERRWAFDRLGRQDLGEKYFLNAGH